MINYVTYVKRVVIDDACIIDYIQQLQCTETTYQWMICKAFEMQKKRYEFICLVLQR